MQNDNTEPVVKALSPGRIGPGLIEATRHDEMHWFPISNLPGESARASLKHARFDELRGEGRDLPGESARASLKPGCSCWRWPR